MNIYKMQLLKFMKKDLKFYKKILNKQTSIN